MASENKMDLKQRKKAEKQKQKDLDKAMKKAVAESRKECRVGERVKQVIVLLGRQLISEAVLMALLVTKLSELGVEYRPCSTSHDDTNNRIVEWARLTTERTVDDDAKRGGIFIQEKIHGYNHLGACPSDFYREIIEANHETIEPYVLVIMSGHNFLELVHNTDKIRKGLHCEGGNTLSNEIQQLLLNHKNKKLTVAIQNLDGALRDQKTQKNRRLRAAVREGGHVSELVKEVTRLQCEQALVEIQMIHGIRCCVRMCQKPEDVSDVIITLTKSIAEIPFHDLPLGTSRKELQESSDKVHLIWQSQLMQFSGVSHPVAVAITSVYSSPAQLIEAYERLSSIEQAKHLLQDIEIRRGTGVISTTRRVGGVLSSRIHSFLTATNKDSLLS